MVTFLDALIVTTEYGYGKSFTAAMPVEVWRLREANTALEEQVMACAFGDDNIRDVWIKRLGTVIMPDGTLCLNTFEIYVSGRRKYRLYIDGESVKGLRNY